MIELLVDRLRWPASLVRERAASQLGKLIANGDGDTASALVTWIGGQDLESLAAIGILPFLYAIERTSLDSRIIDAVGSACKAKSPLSELYIGHLSSSCARCSGLGGHSGPPPPGWQKPIDPSLRPTSSIETVLLHRLMILAPNDTAAWVNQFDYERYILRERYGESPMRANWGCRQSVRWLPSWMAYAL